MDETALSPNRQPRTREGKRLSLVVPLYNEEAVIDLFFQRVEPILAGCRVDYEIVCVNDGSRDASLVRLMSHHLRDKRIKIINLSRNFGKEKALSAGLDAATGDMVVPMDVDLQDPPELVAAFIEKWEQGFDVVYGVREDRSSDTWLKRFTSGAFYRTFNWVSDVELPENVGDFRLMDRRVIEVLKALPERNRFMKGLFAWVGFSQIGVPYARPERAAGSTSWRYWGLWNFALDGITAFSSVPIRIWTYLGFLAGLLALLAAGALVIYTLTVRHDVPGYPSLAVGILMSFGLQMMAIGILGEYIARIYQEVKSRPLYVVMNRFGFD